MLGFNFFSKMVVDTYTRTKSVRSTARICGLTVYMTRKALVLAGLGHKIKTSKGRSSTLSPEEAARYTLWVRTVLVRDSYTCQVCGSKKKPAAHHIRTWAKYEDLRYEVNNGITLCWGCHKKTFKCEHLFEEQLSALITQRGFVLPFIPVPAGPPKELTCTRCGNTFPIETFHKHRRCRYGVRSICAACDREISTAYFHKHKICRRASAAKWQREHRALRAARQIVRLCKIELARIGYIQWTQRRADLGIVCAREEDYRPCAY